MNWGGWVVLTLIFGLLLFVVQRAELKRRVVTAFFMLAVGLIVWNYARYRLGGACDLDWPRLCPTPIMKQAAAAVSVTTVNRALLGALLLNVVYWAFFGRYNPVGSSDAIRVIGRYDDVPV